MKIDFDPAKSAWNVKERGIPFDHVLEADWSKALIGEDKRKDYGEVRLMAYVPIRERLHVAIYVQQPRVRRIISLRKANAKERKLYEKACH